MCVYVRATVRAFVNVRMHVHVCVCVFKVSDYLDMNEVTYIFVKSTKRQYLKKICHWPIGHCL